MTTPAVDEIESRFTNLKRQEQRVLIERLLHQMRLGAGQGNGHRVKPAVTQTDEHRFRREWDNLHVDFKASQGDLLNEAL